MFSDTSAESHDDRAIGGNPRRVTHPTVGNDLSKTTIKISNHYKLSSAKSLSVAEPYGVASTTKPANSNK